MDGQVHRRIQQFIDFLGITNNQFAKEIGDSSAKISQITSERGENPDFQLSFLLKVLGRFPELNSEWLLSGDGPMTKGAGDGVPLLAEFQGAPPQAVPGWKQRLLTAQQEKQTIPLVEQKAYASYLAGLSDPDYLDTRPCIYFPDLKGMGPVIAVRVQGDSMVPSIYPDDILLCSYVEPDAPVKNGQVYVVCHADGVVVKRVQQYSERARAFSCVSDNREYPPFEVERGLVRHLWRVRRRITAFMENTGEDRLAAVEARLAELSQRLPTA